MLSGCEAINLGDYKSPESKYAQGVLKLHANDAGIYAGQEGFLDSIKKGAKSVVDWVRRLIKGLVDWVKSVFSKKTIDNVTITDENKEKFITAIKALKETFSTVTEDQQKEAEVNLSAAVSAVDKLISAAGSNGNVGKQVEDLRSAMITISSKLDSVGKKLKEGDDKKGNAVGKITTIMGRGMNALTKACAMTDGVYIYPQAMQKAIDSGSLSRVRAALMAYIEDNSFSPEDLKELVSHVEKDVPDVYQEYEENTLAGKLAPKDTWSEDTYNTQSSYYTINGSKKRLHLLMNMRNFLREKKVKGFY